MVQEETYEAAKNADYEATPGKRALLLAEVEGARRTEGEGSQTATEETTNSQQQEETTKKANRKRKGGETEERGKNRELRNKTNNGSRSASQAGVSLYK